MKTMLRFVRSVSALCAGAVGMAGVALMTASSTALAQVGHLPSKSPYEDVKDGQEFSFFLGRLNLDPGPAGVLPKASLFGGVRYDLPIGGPTFLTARYTIAPSERDVLNPGKPRSTRLVGVDKVSTHVLDVGISIALTGHKTWHRLVPSISLGTGIASDFAKVDTGGYGFGTKFAFTGGGNVKYLMRNGWAIRADATNYLWRNSYPDAYYAVASDTTPILNARTPKKSFSGQWGFSLGLVIPIFR